MSVTPGAATTLLGQAQAQQSPQLPSLGQVSQGQQQDSLIAVPLSIFSGLLAQLGGALGGAIGGRTGAGIGEQIGQIGASFLPFQVLPQGAQQGVQQGSFQPASAGPVGSVGQLGGLAGPGQGQQGQGLQGSQGQDDLIAVPLSIFSGLLGQLGGFLGGKIGGPTGAGIGQTIGQIGSSFLPFQVLPQGAQQGAFPNGHAGVR